MNAFSPKPLQVASSMKSHPVAMAPALWMLVLAQINPYKFDYAVADLSPLVNLKDHSVRNYCRLIWPDWVGHYVLTYEQMAVLVYRVCRDGQRLPKATDLHRDLLNSGAITSHFPHDRLDICQRAAKAITDERAERKAASNTRSSIGYISEK
jgi:hypothetical protein